MKVLVTGGAGFIASHVAEAHVRRGDRVWVIDDLSTGSRGNMPAGAQLVHIDIRDDRVGDVFAEAGGFDIVSHHAAQIDVRASVADPRHDAALNIDGLLNIAECAVRYGCGRLMFVSSAAIYGEPDVRPTPEDAYGCPPSPYGISKMAGEMYLHYYALQHGLDYAVVRYANVYGPRQDAHGEGGVVAIFCSRLATGAGLTVYGSGEQTRDYVFVGDVAAANLLLAESSLPQPTSLEARAFNVGTGVETTVNELAGTCMSAAGRVVPVAHSPARAGEVMHSSLDAAKLRALGWQPRTALLDGLRTTYEYITSQEAVA